MPEWFDDKEPQLDTTTLTAFGVKMTTRYGKSHELVEMLTFAHYLAARGIETAVTELFYDGQSNTCAVKVRSPEDLAEHLEELRTCGEATLGQFELGGNVYHGPFSGSTEGCARLYPFPAQAGTTNQAPGSRPTTNEPMFVPSS